MHLKAIGACATLSLTLLLAACTQGPKLEETAATSYSGSCQGRGEPAQSDRQLADPAQLKLIEQGKTQYRSSQYGLAQQSFKQAVELSRFAKSPSRTANLEAMFGLAASYDRLKRFDLADQMYTQISAQYGTSVAYHNNLGYSYLLRGDKRAASRQFEAALRLAPDCEISRNNILALRAG